MKRLECPICGGLLEHIEEGYLHIVQCENCFCVTDAPDDFCCNYWEPRKEENEK